MNIRIVKKKIKSIRNVRKITKAMQMVSAVKMRKAQQLEVESRPYRDGLTEMIGKLAKKVEPSQSKLLQVDLKNAKKELIVIVSSNKGLAGSFNINVFRFVLSQYKDFSDVEIVTLGEKGAQFFGRLRGAKVVADFSGVILGLEASALFDFILEKFETGEYRKITIFYNQFYSTLRSEAVRHTLLPLTIIDQANLKSSENLQKIENQTSNELLIEPSASEILEEILKSFLEYKIRGAIISSEAVEHSMRMMAMKSATDNATELIYQMTLLSNRLRQEKITNELLDMITAKESVEA